jgi:hypothetical protein
MKLNDDCARKIWLISKISPSPKIEFIKAGVFVGVRGFA